MFGVDAYCVSNQYKRWDLHKKDGIDACSTSIKIHWNSPKKTIKIIINLVNFSNALMDKPHSKCVTTKPTTYLL